MIQDLKANVVITAGPESQHCHYYMTRIPTWISLQDQKTKVVITAEPGSRWLSGPAMITTLGFYSCSDDHVGFLVLQ
jgi:hypothetical protein